MPESMPVPQPHDETQPVEPIEIRVCERPGCSLRFSSLARDPARLRCPRCRAVTRLVERLEEPLRVPPSAHNNSTGPQLEVLLDNIRSAHNVGSMLRTADGAGIQRVYLCGITPAPDLPAVRKTALGAEGHVHWTVHPDGLVAANRFLQDGRRLWALEGGSRSEPLHHIRSIQGDAPIVLVVGSETAGVDPGILRLCERVIVIPMLGGKGSLNASIAFGVAVYWLRFGTQPNSDG